MPAKFSVVISLYNKQHYIERTLKSVLSQTNQDFEIIVVNDGSTDNSLEIVQTLNDERIRIISQKNKGVSVARNVGINNAEGEFIALLDADDLWMPNYLETIDKAINLFPDQSVFSTAVAHKINDRLNPFKYRFKMSEKFNLVDFFEATSKQPPLFTSAVVFQKSIIEKTGLFNPTIFSGQDTDLWIRFGIHYKVVFINEILVHYNYDNASLSNRTFDMSKKPTFDTYKEIEALRPEVKKFIDRNRYAMSIMAKLHNDDNASLFYRNHIDLEKLPLSKRVLLSTPKWLLKILLKLKAISGSKLHYRPINVRKSL